MTGEELPLTPTEKGLQEWLEEILRRKHPPKGSDYRDILRQALDVLDRDPPESRPAGSDGLPGGLVYLDRTLPVLIVPDLHGRMEFFLAALGFRPDGGSSILELLQRELVQMVCLGDAFHSEIRGYVRWQKAFKEFLGEYRNHRNMDREMRENLGLLEMVLRLKCSFPRHFHFLKGNHENIANEWGDGNYPFMKFAQEGAMVAYYMQKFYEEEIFRNSYLLEKKFPIAAVGHTCMISHAEPRTFYPHQMIIDCRDYPEVIYDLTWTDNDAAETGSVQTMLRFYIDETERERAYYFGGHRSVPERYSLRAGGRYVQINHPERYIVAYVRETGEFDPERDVIDLSGVGQ